MSIKDLAEMIDIEFGISLTLGGLLWFCLYLKLDKIYDELKEIRKEKKEVKHGEWKSSYQTWESTFSQTIECSVCGKEAYEESNFCPNCGADMRGNKDA